MAFETLFLLYLSFNFTDFILTAYALRTGDFKELNPIAKRFSLRGIALIKALISLVVFGILQLPQSPSCIKSIELSLIVSIVFFASISFYNSVLILHSRIKNHYKKISEIQNYL